VIVVYGRGAIIGKNDENKGEAIEEVIEVKSWRFTIL
jgi:hypothetical protein